MPANKILQTETAADSSVAARLLLSFVVALGLFAAPPTLGSVRTTEANQVESFAKSVHKEACFRVALAADPLPLDFSALEVEEEVEAETDVEGDEIVRFDSSLLSASWQVEKTVRSQVVLASSFVLPFSLRRCGQLHTQGARAPPQGLVKSMRRACSEAVAMSLVVKQ